MRLAFLTTLGEEAVVERPIEGEAAGGGSVSVPPTALELDVMRSLRVVGGFGVTLEDLRLHLRVSRREVEEAVQSLRLRGEAIIGDKDGLHLTDDPDEILHYIKVRQGRASELYLGNRELRKTARRLKEQADQEAGLTLWPAA